MGRLVIEITGGLPDEGKYATLASAEEAAGTLVAALMVKHPGLILTASTKAVRPSKKAATPAAVVQRRAAE